MIRECLYNDDRRGLFNALMQIAHKVMTGAESRVWSEAIHRLGVCLFSEGILLLCTEHEAKTIKDIFSNIVTHGKPTIENIRYIEGLLGSLLGKPYQRGRVLDDLFQWVRFGDRTVVESTIGGDLYAACCPERLDKIKQNSTRLVRGRDGDEYRLQTFVDSLMPSRRSVSSSCYNHMACCAKVAKLCHSDPKVVTQINLAIKFLTLHYKMPSVVSRWCTQRVKSVVDEDLRAWLLDVDSRPETPVVEVEREDKVGGDQTPVKRARIV